MKRWWLVIALLLSVGVNIGILATLSFQGRSSVRGGTTTRGTASEDTDHGTLADVAKDPLAQAGRLPPVIRRMANELGLKGEKRAAFTAVQRTFFEQTLAARSRMARLQREIRSEVTAGDPDRETLDQLLLELSAAHTDLERAFVTNLLDSRELLDDKQERRFMHFLRRIRQVRGDVERRFRERWRGMGERGRLGPGQRLERPARPSADAAPVPEQR